jgi:hypothetical protein
MSIEDLTQEEWDEHHKQLDKYLDGVEKRHIARLGAAMGFSREWVGLTDKEIQQVVYDLGTIGDLSHDEFDIARAVIAKLKEKNT